MKSLAVALALTLLVSSASALERRADYIEGNKLEWRVGTETCELAYYNTCTGWIWVWSGWSPQDVVGLIFDGCCPNHKVLETTLYCGDGVPNGYGFEGTIAIHNVENGCPDGAALASQIYFPVTGWNYWTWNEVGVGDQFAIVVTLPNIEGYPGEIVTDHPSAGPTGPAACGSCYTSTRNIHSFWFGTPSSVLCPGSTLADLDCATELVWDARVTCELPTSVGETTWAQIKALYR
jgi:hypothetical protein